MKCFAVASEGIYVSAKIMKREILGRVQTHHLSLPAEAKRRSQQIAHVDELDFILRDQGQ